MNADRLLRYFERIAEAPDAVQRLRRFVLDLAVRGKLVEQDPEDEPAMELLKRIEGEKRRLAKEGELRKENTQNGGNGEFPFAIPTPWAWSQLAQIGSINPKNVADDSVEASFVPMPMIFAEYGQQNQHEVRHWAEIKKGFTHFREGDVALAKITPCFENGKSTVFRGLTGGFGAGTTELHVLRAILVDADYILIFLKSPHFIKSGIPRMTGTAGQKRVPREYFAFSPFPLPPLAEQHRIVAKVHELMALCDELEAAQQKRERGRDRLVAATLHGLNNGTDGEEFRQNARFYFNHLPRLSTRPEHIRQLRQTILNLAVRGKLVPQDPKDASASEILRIIEDERRRAMKKGEIRKQKGLAPIDDVLFDVPHGWHWTRMLTIAANEPNSITDGPFGSNLKTEHYIPTPGYRVVRLQNIGIGTFIECHRSYISKERFERLSKHHVHSGDLVVAGLADPIARSCHVPNDIGPALVKADTFRFKVHSTVSSHYVSFYLNSGCCKSYVESFHHGMTRVRINLQNFKALLIPLPPLAEKDRIVAKVNELMALCDELEAGITIAATTRNKLLEATLHDALSA
jgi:type I restriction enzyme S subunit